MWLEDLFDPIKLSSLQWIQEVSYEPAELTEQGNEQGRNEDSCISSTENKNDVDWNKEAVGCTPLTSMHASGRRHENKVQL